MDKSILIVDDEARAFHMVEYLELASESVLKIDLAQTIEEAFQFLEDNQYNVILCDLCMPPEKFMFKNMEYTFEEKDHFNGGLLIEYCIKKGIQEKSKIFISSIALRRSEELVEKFNYEVEMLPKHLLSMSELLEKIENAH